MVFRKDASSLVPQSPQNQCAFKPPRLALDSALRFLRSFRLPAIHS
jgi:hypothetical protein